MSGSQWANFWKANLWPEIKEVAGMQYAEMEGEGGEKGLLWKPERRNAERNAERGAEVTQEIRESQLFRTVAVRTHSCECERFYIIRTL